MESGGTSGKDTVQVEAEGVRQGLAGNRHRQPGPRQTVPPAEQWLRAIEQRRQRTRSSTSSSSTASTISTTNCANETNSTADKITFANGDNGSSATASSTSTAKHIHRVQPAGHPDVGQGHGEEVRGETCAQKH
jgi:hypothetical protein